MTDDTPVWFMDVDGVLNAFPNSATDKDITRWSTFKASPNRWPRMTEADKEEAQWCPGGLKRYNITFDQSIIDRIVKLHETETARVVWLTTWGRGANGELRAGLRMPSCVSAGEPTYKFSGLMHTDEDGQWWKWGCASRFLEKHPDVTKFVWTDDDLWFEERAFDWAIERGGFPVKADTDTGLTHEQLDAIEQYLAT